MAGGIQLSALVDLFLATSQAVLTGENFILNEAQPRRTILRQIMKAHDMVDMLQGGDSITDQVIFDEDSTYSAYNPLEPKAPRLGNHLTEISVQWALSDAHVTFSKHEKGLNMASQLKRGARAMVFKKIIKAKWSNLFVSINRGMERELMATPVNGTMETVTTGTRVPYSIFATITEFGSDLTTPNPTGILPPGFTTVQTINSTTQPRWRNPVEFYADGLTEIDAGGTANWDGFDAFQVMADRLGWEDLAIRPEYGEAEDPEAFYICSKNGKKLYSHATRRSNDYLRHGPSNAAYPGLNYDGAPIKWIEAMDTAVVWSSAITGTGVNSGENDGTLDENGVATQNPFSKGPRFVCIVPKYFKKIVHSEHFLEEETPPPSVFQPYQRTVFFDCWHQNFNRSRQRAGGVIMPGASTGLTVTISGVS